MAISTMERIGLLRKCYFEETRKEHGMNPHEIHAKPTRFLRMLGQQKYCQLGLKGTERVWNQRRLLDPQMVLPGRRLIKLTYKVLPLWKRKDDLGVATSLEGKTKSLEGETKSPGGRDKRVMVDHSQAFKPNPDPRVCPAGFQSYLRLMTPFYFPFLNLNVCNSHPMPGPPWVLGRQGR